MIIYFIVRGDIVEIRTDQSIFISRTIGINYLEELFTHPDKVISATTLYFALLKINFDRFITPEILSSPGIDLMPFDGSKDCRGKDVMDRYACVMNKLREAELCNDEVRIAYYSDKAEALEQIILGYKDKIYDSMTNSANRSVRQNIKYALESIKKVSLPLYNHIQKTISFGVNLCYHPENDLDVDLMLRQG
jgi:hypothetical protein